MTECSVLALRRAAGCDYIPAEVREMLTAYADLREQIERAREGVSDEVVQIVADQLDVLFAVEDAQEPAFLDDVRKIIQSVAHLLPGERGGVDGAEDSGEHDAAVWTLIALAEESGAVKDEGEDGTFWTLDLAAVYQLESQLRVRNINAGWPEPNHPPAQAAPVDAVRAAYRAGFIEACGWPGPVAQDVDSPAFDRAFRHWNNEAAVDPPLETIVGTNLYYTTQAVLAELKRAITKFPTWPADPLHAAGVVNEEVGELNKAVLQAMYEPDKNPPDAVRTEAIQAGAMVIRFLLALPGYNWTPGTQTTPTGETP